MNIKLPADIEEIIAALSEERRKIWLARFEQLTPAARRAAIKSMREFVTKYSEPPDDFDDPPTEAERQEREQGVHSVIAHINRLN